MIEKIKKSDILLFLVGMIAINATYYLSVTHVMDLGGWFAAFWVVGVVYLLLHTYAKWTTVKHWISTAITALGLILFSSITIKGSEGQLLTLVSFVVLMAASAGGYVVGGGFVYLVRSLGLKEKHFLYMRALNATLIIGSCWVIFSASAQKYDSRVASTQSMLLSDALVEGIQQRPDAFKTNAEEASQSILDTFYPNKENDHNINEFGGTVSIESRDNGIALIYTNIPNGEPCKYFVYFTNGPQMAGFRVTHVNGKEFSFKRDPSRTACRKSDIDVEFYLPFK
jgi:hypothetical protein